MYIYLCTYSYVCVYVFLYVCYMTICSQYLKCQKIKLQFRTEYLIKNIYLDLYPRTQTLFPPNLSTQQNVNADVSASHSILAESFINNEAGFTLTPYLLSDTVPGSLCKVKPQENRV